MKRGRMAEDLSGRQFGRLTVLRRTDNRHGRVCWLCSCTCGNEKAVTALQLKNGSTKSCGCLRREMLQQSRDLAGMRFHHLVALERTQQRDYKGSVYWRCRCDCGNETMITADRLVNGKYTSCGCKKREAQAKVGKTLTFTDGTCIEWLKNRKSRSDNTSGFRGVCERKNGTYRAGIGFKGRKYYLGIYSSYEDAVEARCSAEHYIHENFIERYENWRRQQQDAVREGDCDWARRHPLIFEVDRGEPGVLEIRTNDGVQAFRYGESDGYASRPMERSAAE